MFRVCIFLYFLSAPCPYAHNLLQRGRGWSWPKEYWKHLEKNTQPEDNPYLTLPPFRLLDDLDPVAPENRVGQESEKEPSYGKGAVKTFDYVHIPKWVAAHNNGFPGENGNGGSLKDGETKNTVYTEAGNNAGNETSIEEFSDHGAKLHCHDTPTTWVDKNGYGCGEYTLKGWCANKAVDATKWNAAEKEGLFTGDIKVQEANSTNHC